MVDDGKGQRRSKDEISSGEEGIESFGTENLKKKK
jgi:hypothetical protein